MDCWLKGIVQKSILARTKITGNLGILFAGNNSTGLIGIQTRGRVYTDGTHVVRKFTERLSLGPERQEPVSISGGGGRYGASPIVGAQVGISVDFPAFASSTASSK